MDQALTLVIGAGLSGLHAAWRLQEAGHAVMLVDARERTGGRILSRPVSEESGHAVDLGPSWFWPELNPLLNAWIQRLGLDTYPQHSQGASWLEGPDVSLRRLEHSWEQRPRSMRVSAGMAGLVHGIQALLTRVQWLPGTRVESMQLRPDGGVIVELQQGERRWQQQAARVISTLPPRLLAQLQVQPAWPAEQVQAWDQTPTWMAGQAKFVAVYERAFWREAGFSGAAISHRGPLAEIHDASSHSGDQAALFGFVGLTPAYRQGIGEPGLRRQALCQLSRLFGPEALTPRWTAVQDWAQDPLTAQALDQRPLHHHPMYRAPEVPAQWRDRLWLAGTEFAEQSGEFLEGALEAAEAAVDDLLASDAGSLLRA